VTISLDGKTIQSGVEELVIVLAKVLSDRHSRTDFDFFSSRLAITVCPSTKGLNENMWKSPAVFPPGGCGIRALSLVGNEVKTSLGIQQDNTDHKNVLSKKTPASPICSMALSLIIKE